MPRPQSAWFTLFLAIAVVAAATAPASAPTVGAQAVPPAPPGSASQAPSFADDFSADPNTSGRWTIHRFSGDPANEASWSGAEGAVYLTRDERGKGAVMLANYALETSSWRASFRYRSTGPDGLVFAFYKDAGGYGLPAAGGFLAFEATLSPQCGYGRIDCNIPVAGYGIELDQYRNWEWDSDGAHIAVIQDTVAHHLTSRPDSGLGGDGWHSVVVTYDAMRVTAEVDGRQLVDSAPLPAPLHGGVGFSAASGAESGDHVIDDFTIWSTSSPSPTPSATDEPTATVTVPPSDTPTRPPTDTPASTPTATATDTPVSTATPAEPARCVCPVTLDRVPAVIILDALTNPQRFYGWRYRLDPGKPPSPVNPRRECLSLANVNVRYHPLWNRPVWRAGCP